MPRVVLDTNILVSDLLSPTGNPAKIYNLFLTGILTLIFSADIFAEYLDVLHRPSLNIPPDDTYIVLDAILKHGKHVRPALSTISILDEDDRIFYDAAKSADAYLITGNIRHYPQDQFILTPTAFLDSIFMP